MGLGKSYVDRHQSATAVKPAPGRKTAGARVLQRVADSAGTRPESVRQEGSARINLSRHSMVAVIGHADAPPEHARLRLVPSGEQAVPASGERVLAFLSADGSAIEFRPAGPPLPLSATQSATRFGALLPRARRLLTSSAPQLLQRRADPAAASGDAAPAVEQALATESSLSLPRQLRRNLESAYAADLSGVRLHTDTVADRAARSIQARAFTSGQDVYFRSGQFAPETAAGRHLLAHEVAHTVQQQGASRPAVAASRDDDWVVSASHDALEQEADRAAAAAMRGETASWGSNAGQTEMSVIARRGMTDPVAVTIEAPETVTSAAGSMSLEDSTAVSAVAGSGGVTSTQAASDAGDSSEATAAVVESSAGDPDTAVVTDGPSSSRGDFAAGLAARRGDEEIIAAGTPRTAVDARVEFSAAAPTAGNDGTPLLIPEPPAGLSPDAQRRLADVSESTGQAAASHAQLPGERQHVEAARAAVDEPAEQASAHAEASLVAALGERPAPAAEIEILCERIREVIHSKRPLDEGQLVKAEPIAMAREAGAELNSAVQGDTGRVQGEFDALQQPPTASPQPAAQPLQAPPECPAGNGPAADSAAPDAVPAEHVSLAADVAANEERIQQAGMRGPAADLVQSGPIADARQAHAELQQSAQVDPQQVLERQQAALTEARGEMASLQESALAALAASRRSTVVATTTRQTGMVGTEAGTRRAVSQQAHAIFTTAQTQVRAQLQPLAATALDEWDRGVAVLATQFKARLKVVEDWLHERHEGTWGAIVGFWDDVTGMPAFVHRSYDEAEQLFGDGACELARSISLRVNAVIAACQQIIADTERQIDALFGALPAELQAWAAGEQAGFRLQLAALRQETIETRDSFTHELVNRAGRAVQDVRTQIHELRTKARGLIGRTLDAIQRFLDDPAREILNGLLDLAGIPTASFWAVVERIQSVVADIAADPLAFANNLLQAVQQGFGQFFDHIDTHLSQSFLSWLLSGLQQMGIDVPRDVSLKSIVTCLLQVMGISWDRIRKLLARHIGEENVALLERAWSLVSEFIEQGPQGLFDLLENQLNPRQILDQLLTAAQAFLVESVIKAASVRLLALFNPAGAILQALEAIYRVLSWVFENAARLFGLVETVVGGMAEILKGNIGGMAAAIESSLAGLISPVIDFLADYLGFGDLPEKIAETIRSFQDWVESLLDRVIAWLATRAKALLTKLGIREEERASADGEYDGEIGKVVTFTAGDEQHRLWIDVRGDDAVVMMASGHGRELEAHLSSIKERLTSIENESERARIQSLLNTIRSCQRQIGEWGARGLGAPDDQADERALADEQIAALQDVISATLSVLLAALDIDAPTGRSSAEAIPILWFKPASLYQPIRVGETLLQMWDEQYVVIPPRFHVPRNTSSLLVEWNPSTAEQLGNVADDFSEFVASSEERVRIGVSREYLPRRGKIMRITGSQPRGVEATFKRMLVTLGFSWSDYAPDHVQDLQFEGPDAIDNLWPLQNSRNADASTKVRSQLVRYKNANGVIETKHVSSLPVGLYVCIHPESPTS